MTSDTKKWQLKMMVRYESIFANKEAIVQRYMDLKVNPDQVYKWLKLDKESRRFNQGVATPNYKLWKSHKAAWVEKFPDLASNLKFK
ncbi:hypothetical protein PHMEG_00016695 [Phytophthora megakarya]|uniref:Avirulence (Avh) protein n=1 Tax=Phytophthora megakarya TaxID=4795 RepID=A0A225VY58_9STRA|nr:hypothetical protein PHMEG_00016695 [Phytophthora megakarya]